jgi:hypothetical protein
VSAVLKSNLSISYRVELLTRALLTESQIRDLISDAMAQNMTHLLPREVVRYGEELVKSRQIKVPES